MSRLEELEKAIEDAIRCAAAARAACAAARTAYLKAMQELKAYKKDHKL